MLEDEDDMASHLNGNQQAGAYTPLMIRKLEPNCSNDSEHYAKPSIRRDHEKGMFIVLCDNCNALILLQKFSENASGQQ